MKLSFDALFERTVLIKRAAEEFNYARQARWSIHLVLRRKNLYEQHQKHVFTANAFRLNKMLFYALQVGF